MLAVATLGILATACGGGGNPIIDTGMPCMVDDDCPGGFACNPALDTCFEICSSATECKAGFVCTPADICVAGNLTADFDADNPSGDPRISMEPGPASGSVFSVQIQASAITDLYGAAFTVLYTPGPTTYIGCQALGSILLDNGALTNSCDGMLVGGAKFDAALENGIEGILNVRASRDGLVPGIAGGTGLLLTLTFQANFEIAPPGEPYVFEAGSSREVLACPQDLSPCSVVAVSWDGGSVTAQTQ